MAEPEVGSDAWKAQNKGHWILITCWVVTAISTLFVIARVYVRGWLQGKLQLDDWWTILGQICGFISTGLSTAAVASGNGKHFSLLTVEQQQGAILWTTAAFCPGVISFGLPKLAVVYLLTRLLNPSRLHKAFLWWLGIWCLLTLFATVGVLLGRCTPARSLWDFSVKGTCFDNTILVAYCIYAGVFSAFVDIYLAVYPSIVLFNLQISLKKKMALSVALGIGLVSGAIAIYKTTRIPSLASPDFSYDTSDLVVWTVIEGSTIIIACSIPIMQPLVEKIMRRNPFSSSADKRSGPSDGRYYEDYQKSSRSRPRYELGERKPRSKLKDDLGLTVLPDGGSEEEILSPANGYQANAHHTAYATSDDHSAVEKQQAHHQSQQPSSGPSSLPHREPGQIMRTDVVTVSYDEEAQAGQVPRLSRKTSTSLPSHR